MLFCHSPFLYIHVSYIQLSLSLSLLSLFCESSWLHSSSFREAIHSTWRKNSAGVANLRDLQVIGVKDSLCRVQAGATRCCLHWCGGSGIKTGFFFFKEAAVFWMLSFVLGAKKNALIIIRFPMAVPDLPCFHTAKSVIQLFSQPILCTSHELFLALWFCPPQKNGLFFLLHAHKATPTLSCKHKTQNVHEWRCIHLLQHTQNK